MSAAELTRGQRAARNFLGLLVGTVGEGALQFLFVVLASRYLGPENFGFWGFSSALIGYLLIVAGFGLPQIVVREIARMPNDTGRIFGSAMGLRLLLGLILCVAVSGVLPFAELSADRRTTLFLLSLALLVMPFDLAPFFDAHQQSRWDAIFRLAARSISIGFLGLFIWTQRALTLPVVAFTSLVFLIFNVGFAWSGAKWLGLILRPRLMPSEMRQMAKLALPIFWAQAMSEFYIHTNLILLGFFSTDRETGFYAAADRILLAILTLKGILYRLLIPLLSEVAHDHDRLIKRLEIVMPLVAQITVLIAVAAILVADPVLEMVFGTAYSPAIWPFRILAGYIIFTGVGSIFGTTLFATGRQRQYSLSITVGSLINLLLCFALIPLLGAVGAAISSATAEIVVLTVSFSYFRRDFRPTFFPSLVRTFVAGVAMATAYSAIPFEGTFAFAGKLLGGGVAYGCVLWVLGELSPAKIETLHRLFRMPRD